MERASIEVAQKPRSSVSIAGVKIGGQKVTVIGGSFAWPSSGVLNHTIPAPFLSMLGIIDAVALMGGGLILGRRLARNFKPDVRVAPGKATE